MPSDTCEAHATPDSLPEMEGAGQSAQDQLPDWRDAEAGSEAGTEYEEACSTTAGSEEEQEEQPGIAASEGQASQHELQAEEIAEGVAAVGLQEEDMPPLTEGA